MERGNALTCLVLEKYKRKGRMTLGGRQQFFAFAEPAELENGRASVYERDSEVTGSE
jgi:hypothetical protein